MWNNESGLIKVSIGKICFLLLPGQQVALRTVTAIQMQANCPIKLFLPLVPLILQLFPVSKRVIGN